MKNTIITTGIVAIAVCAAGWALAPDDTADVRADDSASSIEKVIRGLHDELNQAVLDGDVATFDRLFADDFTHTTYEGRFRTKAEWMKGKVQGQSRYVSFDVEDLKVRVYGDSAVVTGQSKPAWREAGETIKTGRFRFLNMWVRRDGRWQVVAFQATQIQDGKE